MAYDYVTSKIPFVRETMDQGLMYLGDSENDNAAFNRADVSIGVISDDRLNPKLSCTDIVNFDSLPEFLKRLKLNGFVFSRHVVDSR
jgi:soluble P-type ATPase